MVKARQTATMFQIFPVNLDRINSNFSTIQTHQPITHHNRHQPSPSKTPFTSAKHTTPDFRAAITPRFVIYHLFPSAIIAESHSDCLVICLSVPSTRINDQLIKSLLPSLGKSFDPSRKDIIIELLNISWSIRTLRMIVLLLMFVLCLSHLCIYWPHW